jgi:membrane-bound lytic murein transglycosylase B
MVLPTMSVRVDPTHHGLIRDIATALRSRPELPDVLRDVLQTQHEDRVTERDTDVLQRILERLANEEEVSRKIMAFVENLSDRVKVLETATAEHSRPAATRQRYGRIPDNIRQKAHQLRQEGRTYKQIATELGIADGTVHGIINKPRAE